jgi:putative spermidine/putrescine transport system permease protein
VAVATPTEPMRGAPRVRPASRRSWAWLGLVPFFLFAILFLLIPVVFLVAGSLHDAKGGLTVQNYVDLGREDIITAFRVTIEISLVTAIVGGIAGFLVAYAIILGGISRRIRGPVLTFSGVASNFAGVPLALAFIFTLGQMGLVTLFLQNVFGISLRLTGFNLYSKLGLEIVYVYFQLPLMILIIAPAIDGLRREWREAAENLGASSFQYWRRVALPILAPSILGATILLFGNAFGAQATAYQLTGGGGVPIVTVKIGGQISGDVLHNPGLGYSMAVGMIIVMSVALVIYALLSRRAERWSR